MRRAGGLPEKSVVGGDHSFLGGFDDTRTADYGAINPKSIELLRRSPAARLAVPPAHQSVNNIRSIISSSIFCFAHRAPLHFSTRTRACSGVWNRKKLLLGGSGQVLWQLNGVHLERHAHERLAGEQIDFGLHALRQFSDIDRDVLATGRAPGTRAVGFEWLAGSVTKLH